jgi:tRNA (guanosine-2'-O-)-methyltransferase
MLLEAERQRRAAGLYGVSRLAPAEHDRTLFEWCYPEIAERCRQHGRDYPPLTDDGMMACNPLLGVAAK